MIRSKYTVIRRETFLPFFHFLIINLSNHVTFVSIKENKLNKYCLIETFKGYPTHLRLSKYQLPSVNNGRLESCKRTYFLHPVMKTDKLNINVHIKDDEEPFSGWRLSKEIFSWFYPSRMSLKKFCKSQHSLRKTFINVARRF